MSDEREIITRIERIEDAGYFKDWSWTEGCADLRSNTVIYGANGSGKSTLARALREAKGSAASGLQLTTSTGRRISAGDGDVLWDRIKVFDRGYVEEHLSLDHGEPQTGLLLSLDADAEGRRVRLKELPEKVASARAELKTEQGKAEVASRRLEQLYRAVGTRVREACRRDLPAYNNYNAGDAKRVLAPILDSLSPTDEVPIEAVPSDSQIAQTIERIQAPTPPSVVIPATPDWDWSELLGRAEVILAEQPQVERLEDLSRNPAVVAWVQDGLDLHAGTHDCHFCASELTKARRSALEAHFKADDLQKVQTGARAILGELRDRIDDGSRYVAAVHNAWTKLSLDIPVAVADWLEGAHSAIEGRRRSLQGLMAALDVKATSPTEMPEVDPVALPDLPPFSEAAECFVAHNLAVENEREVRQEAATALEKQCAWAAVSGVREEAKALADAHDAAGWAEELLEKLQNEKEVLEATDIGDPTVLADQLNSSLGSLLGRNELSFQVEQGRYRIKRSGQPAKDLSEGEQRAIALLHFLANLDQTGPGADPPEDGWLVIVDDPVSSMDASVLLGTFAALWGRVRPYDKNRQGTPAQARDVTQVILLTHSGELLRVAVAELKDKLVGPTPKRPDQEPKAVVIEVRPRFAPGGGEPRQRTPRLVSWPPKHWVRLLGSEYHYLFWRIGNQLLRLESEELDADEHLDALVTAPNLSRRLLEGFASFYAPSAGSFADQVAELESTSSLPRMSRMMDGLNEGSHHRKVDVPRPIDPDEAVAVIRDLFLLMFRAEPRHVERMCVAVELPELHKLLKGRYGPAPETHTIPA